MHRVLLVPTLAWLAGATAAPAAAQPAAASLVPEARVRISAPRHRVSRLTGSVARVDRDSIWIRAVRQDSTWTYNERNIWVVTNVGPPRDTIRAVPLDALTRLEVSAGRRSRVGGMARSAAKGFLYTGAVGAVLGLFVRDPDGFFYNDPGGGAVFWGVVLGTLGGTVGGLYGLAAPGERWRRLPLPLRQP